MANEFYDTLRMRPSDIQALLEEHRERESDGASQRSARRWMMQQQKAIVTLIDAYGTKTNLIVVPRNLSTGGVGFFHGGFVYTGTQCFVTMRALSGSAHPIRGRVVRCVHKRGRMHEIGVRFDEEISPREYFIDVGDAPLFNAEAVDIANLRGTALIVAESAAERSLVADHFRESGMIITSASDATSAIDKLVNEDPDIVFADASLADMPWRAFVQSLRDGGFVGPIILLASQPDQSLRISALTAGASEVIFKPLSASILHRAAAEYLLTASSISSDLQPMISELDAGKVSRDVIASYIDELHDNAVALHHALRENDFDALKRVFNAIGATAHQFGFPALGDTAREAESLLDNPDGSRIVKLLAYEVMKMCRRAEAPIDLDSLVDDSGVSPDPGEAA